MRESPGRESLFPAPTVAISKLITNPTVFCRACTFSSYVRLVDRARGGPPRSS